MQRRASLLFLSSLLVAGCGSQAQSAGPETNASARAPTSDSPGFDVHEWGVVAVRNGSFELAAGAGQRANTLPLTVDKPVLYVHSSEASPFTLRVRVNVASTLQIAEHFPPTSLGPLEWTTQVGGACSGSYPPVTDTCPGGYCEVAELATYETEDAACLDVDGVRAPLLFYRLWAPGSSPELPLQVLERGEAWEITNTAIERPIGRLWRVRYAQGETHAAAVDLPPLGQRVSVDPPDGDASAAWTHLLAAASEIGLTAPEVSAFDRAWGRALFGAAGGSDGDGVADGVDTLTADESLDRISRGGPRDLDVLLYWLPDANIDAMAELDIEPAPRNVRRAFLVRHVLR